MTAGSLSDTYVAAIQHGLADVPESATLVGVVRRPTPWFHAAVDENRPALGPPEDLLAEFQDRRDALELRGLCEAGAHNAAWDELDVESRYRAHLDESTAARDAVADLRDRLASGDDLALVCFENTGKKRCHRTTLRDILADGG